MISVAYSIVAAVPVSIYLGIFAVKVLPAYIVVPNLSKKKKLPMNSIFTWSDSAYELTSSGFTN